MNERMIKMKDEWQNEWKDEWKINLLYELIPTANMRYSPVSKFQPTSQAYKTLL